jgi:hypothetical protein
MSQVAGGGDSSPQRVRGVGLYTPQAIDVTGDEEGLPTGVNGVGVETALEDWLVTDAWWSGRPVRRRYFELVLEGGSNITVFRDLNSGDWFSQRA